MASSAMKGVDSAVALLPADDERPQKERLEVDRYFGKDEIEV